MNEKIPRVGVQDVCGKIIVFDAFPQIDNFILMCEKCGNVIQVTRSDDGKLHAVLKGNSETDE